MMQPATLTVVEDAHGIVAWPPLGVAVDIMPSESRSFRRRRRRPKRRIEIVGPSIVTGGSVAFTRLPSGKRRSAIGEAVSMRAA